MKHQYYVNIHNNGKELCGTYTYEIASTKVAQVKNGKRKRLSFKSCNGRRIKMISKELRNIFCTKQ